MLTHHLNYVHGGDVIYCERLGHSATVDQRHFGEFCAGCPFFAGHMQGDGIECLYYDSTGDSDLVIVDDPFEFAEKRQPFMGKGPVETEGNV